MKKKVRINELARELEVKPNKILEMLPELGVVEKKTHSSSIDEDVANIVKQRLIGSPDSDFSPDDEDLDDGDLTANEGAPAEIHSKAESFPPAAEVAGPVEPAAAAEPVAPP